MEIEWTIRPRWPVNFRFNLQKKVVPIAVLWAERGNSHRERLLKICRRTLRPKILLYIGGGIQGDRLCPENMHSHLDLGNDVVIFSWTTSPTPKQLVLLQYLHRNWENIPFKALQFIQELPYIPVDDRHDMKPSELLILAKGKGKQFHN